MTAAKDIAVTASLFSFDFAAPGASGVVLIDGMAVQVFTEQRHLRIHREVSAGNHMFNLKLIRPTALTFMSSDRQFQYCRS